MTSNWCQISVTGHFLGSDDLRPTKCFLRLSSLWLRSKPACWIFFRQNNSADDFRQNKTTDDFAKLHQRQKNKGSTCSSCDKFFSLTFPVSISLLDCICLLCNRLRFCHQLTKIKSFSSECKTSPQCTGENRTGALGFVIYGPKVAEVNQLRPQLRQKSTSIMSFQICVVPQIFTLDKQVSCSNIAPLRGGTTVGAQRAKRQIGCVNPKYSNDLTLLNEKVLETWCDCYFSSPADGFVVVWWSFAWKHQFPPA